MLERNFEAVAEDHPGTRRQALFQRRWLAHRRWLLPKGCRAQFLGAFQAGLRTVRYPTVATPRAQLHRS